MDFTDISDIASMVSVAVVIATVIAWLIRRWVRDLVNGAVARILPNLTNDEQSVAKYAHEARDAAVSAKEAALDAKDAAIDARDAAHHAAESAQNVGLAVAELSQRFATKED